IRHIFERDDKLLKDFRALETSFRLVVSRQITIFTRDENFMIIAFRSRPLQLKAYRDQADRPSHKYNVHSLKESVKTNAFRCELRNRFSALDTLPEETIEEHWHDLRETWTATCREVLGKKTRQHKEWLTSDTWDLITDRKRLKDLINHTDDQDH
ncbi:hypothetical protein BaRGS_00034828, partial [Batillaria attramentaria]